MIDIDIHHGRPAMLLVAPGKTSGDNRPLDVALGLLALLFCLPIMLLVAAGIYVEDGGPVFFVQSRVGLGGRIFRCIKFRSMAVDADHRLEALLRDCPEARRQWTRNRKLQRDPRVTLVGRLIRERSLDELPQLINVLRGDMGLVGPRPIMVEETALYGRRLALYATMRPGITGLWQINGRGDTSFRTRIAMDTAYVRRRSFWLDAWICLVTIPTVMLGRGSY